jgi:hypothetical protein
LKKLIQLVGCGTLLVGVVAAASSGSGCDSAKAAFDCQQVCERYKDCYNQDYDVGACRNQCRSMAEKNDTWQDKADDCASCIGDKSCLNATFSCATECAGIVP